MPAQSLNILIAEDDRLARELLQSYLEGSGHHVIHAENGEQAINIFTRETLDLVILDVKMPVMDGLEACRYIKNLMKNRWVPLMLISSSNEVQDEVAGLEVGADYFLGKPISFPVLAAKVKSSQRITSLQRELESRNEELLAYYRKSQVENEMAQRMIDRILEHSTTPDTRIQQSVRAMDQFSGDVVSTVKSESGDTYAMVADATGHGLPAAIALMPAMEIFYQMSSRGYRVATIVRQINHRLQEQLPPNHFLAATVLLISPQDHTLFAWNGGCPQAYVLAPDGTLNHRIPPQHAPLGVLDDDVFDETTQLCSVNTHDRFFACTDGLTEAQNERGTMFGRKRLESVLQGCRAEDDLVKVVTTALNQFRGRALPGDDQSMLALSIDPPVEASLPDTPGPEKALPAERNDERFDGWALKLELRGSDIRSTEIIPTVNQVLENLRLSERLRQRAFVVLTELLNNAVDHGLLGLDSSSKNGDGFERYIEEREQRLAALREGFIRIMAARSHTLGHNVLKLTVMDSGPGFSISDHTIVNPEGAVTAQVYGRGIRVVSSLVDRIRFLDNGATIEVEFTIDPE